MSILNSTHASIGFLFLVCLWFDVTGLLRIGAGRWWINYGALILFFINLSSAVFYLCAAVRGDVMWWEGPRGHPVLLWRHLLWLFTAPLMVLMMSRLSGPYRGPLSMRRAVMSVFVMLLGGLAATGLPWYPFGAPALVLSSAAWIYVMRVMWGLNDFAASAAVARQDGRSLDNIKWLNMGVWAFFSLAWVSLEAGAPPIWCEMATCAADVFAKGIYSFYFRNAVLLDANGYRALPAPSTAPGLEEYMATGKRLLSLMVRKQADASSIASLVDEVLAECVSENPPSPQSVGGEGPPIRAIDALAPESIPFALLAEMAIEAASAGIADVAPVPDPGVASLPLVIELCVDEIGLLASASAISLHYSCDSRVTAATGTLFDQELLRAALAAALLAAVQDPGTSVVWIRATLSDREGGHGGGEGPGASELALVIESLGLPLGSSGDSSGVAGLCGPEGFKIAERLSRAMGGSSSCEACFSGSGVRCTLAIPVGAPIIVGGESDATWNIPQQAPVPVYLRDPDPARPEVREYIARSLSRRGLAVTDDLAVAVAVVESYSLQGGLPGTGELPTVALNEPRESRFAPLPVTSTMIDRAAERVRAMVGGAENKRADRSISQMRVLEVMSASWDWQSSRPRALALQGVINRTNIKHAPSCSEALDCILHDGPWDIVYLLCPSREEGEEMAEAIRASSQAVPGAPMPLIVGAFHRPGGDNSRHLIDKALQRHGRTQLDRVGHLPLRPSFLRENVTVAVNRSNLAAKERGMVKDAALETSSSLQSMSDSLKGTNLPGARTAKFEPKMPVIVEDDEEDE
jgi:hypothetical protein